MRILHISPYFPDLKTNHAGGVCMGRELENLRKQHEVQVLTFVASDFDEKLAGEHAGDETCHWVRISRLSRAVHALVLPWLPNYFAARSSLRFAWKLVCLVKKYRIQAIHAEYASMGQYLWIRRIFPGLRFHLVEHDMTAQSFERKCTEAVQKAAAGGPAAKLMYLYARDQLRKVKKQEGRYCRKADRVFVFNEKDRRLIRDFYGVDSLVLNPYFGLEDSLLQENFAAPEPEKQRYSVCFLGQMGRPENDRAGQRLIEICRRVKEALPDLRLYLVGNRPSETLLQKAEEANRVFAENGIETEDSSPQKADADKAENWVTVTGFVEDVDSYVRRAELAVFPLEMGAGIKVKVLRALALGTPVITGQVGAEGIDEDYRVIVPAETDEEYAERIVKLLESPEELKERSAMGRAFIREHFAWEKSEEMLGDVYSNTVQTEVNGEEKGCSDYS